MVDALNFTEAQKYMTFLIGLYGFDMELGHKTADDIYYASIIKRHIDWVNKRGDILRLAQWHESFIPHNNSDAFLIFGKMHDSPLIRMAGTRVPTVTALAFNADIANIVPVHMTEAEWDIFAGSARIVTPVSSILLMTRCRLVVTPAEWKEFKEETKAKYFMRSI